MGTTFRIVLYAPDRPHADRAFQRAFERIAALDTALSDYRDSSELSRITREAVDAPAPISDDLFNVLSAVDSAWPARATAPSTSRSVRCRGCGAGLAGRSNCHPPATSPPRER